jgi:hypothetical protein
MHLSLRSIFIPSWLQSIYLFALSEHRSSIYVSYHHAALFSLAYLVNVTLVAMLIISTYRLSAGLSMNNHYCPGFREAMLSTQRGRMATTMTLFVLSVVLSLVDLVWQWLEAILKTRWTRIKEPRVMAQVADYCGMMGVKRYTPPSVLQQRPPALVQKVVRTLSIPLGICLFLGPTYLLEYQIIFRFHQDMKVLGYTSSEDQWSYSQILSLVIAASMVASLTGRILLQKLFAVLHRFRWFRAMTSKIRGTLSLISHRSRKFLDFGYRDGLN